MKQYFLRLFLLASSFIFLLPQPNLNAQITSAGKDFWFGFMSNIITDNRTYQLKVFISSEIGATGTISIPGKAWSQNFVIPANSSTVIDVPTNVGHVTSSEVIEAQAIHVVADNDVNVFELNYSPQTSDGGLILPVKALGKQYFVLSYVPIQSSEFMVVAAYDGTTVRITPVAATAGGKPANIPFDINLNKGDVYQVQSATDLTGSSVVSIGSQFPVAVFGGAACANVPNDKMACNHLFEQMFPNNTLRRSFVTIPYKTRLNGDTYRILAIKDGTNVTFDGGGTVNLNKGQFVEKIITNPTYINSDLPIAVAQYSNGTLYDGVIDADPFFIMLSPVEQTRDDISFEVFNFATINGNYVNIAVGTSCTGDVQLDGAPVAGWVPVAGNPAYSVVQLTVPQGAHRLVSSKDCGFNAYVYGYGAADSYGYAAGVRLDTLSIALTAFTDCAGKETEFFVQSTPYSIKKYDWNFGDGGLSSQAKPKHIYSAGGTYTVKLIVTYVTDDADTVITTFTIGEPKVNLGADVKTCFNVPIQIGANGTDGTPPYKYQWIPSTGLSAANTPFVTANPTNTTDYVLMVTDQKTCVALDTIRVTILPLPKPVVNPAGPIEICDCDSVTLDAGNLGYVRYTWSTGATTQKITVRLTNDYTVTVTDTNGCVNASPPVKVHVKYPYANINMGAPAYSVYPGGYIDIPFYISKSEYLNECNSRNWIAEISFNKFIIVPESVTPKGVFDNDFRRISISGIRGLSDTLLTLHFMGTLGDVTTSPITIDSFKWTDCNTADTLTNSKVDLTGLCNEGGTTRLFKSPKTAFQLIVSPNPIQDRATIISKINEEIAVKITINDLNGRLSSVVFEGLQKEGEKLFIKDFSQYPNGTYVITMITPLGVETQIVEVQK